uniref:Uncharacterized protein n=1 Tax=Lepeophtheirus salmonis TaxID=72036 RepID=A0A0K2TUB4_LEPSM
MKHFFTKKKKINNAKSCRCWKKLVFKIVFKKALCRSQKVKLSCVMRGFQGYTRKQNLNLIVFLDCDIILLIVFTWRNIKMTFVT